MFNFMLKFINRATLKQYGPSLLYVTFWIILMFAATFPDFISKKDISFIDSLPLVNQKCLFPLVMVIVIHLIEVAYLVFTTEMTEKQLKKSFIFNLLFLALVAVLLMFMSSVGSLCCRLTFFFLVWIVIAIIKFLSIKISMPESINIKDFSKYNK